MSPGVVRWSVVPGSVFSVWSTVVGTVGGGLIRGFLHAVRVQVVVLRWAADQKKGALAGVCVPGTRRRWEEIESRKKGRITSRWTTAREVLYGYNGSV